MLDVIMRSLGLDPAKVQSMMDEASSEYKRQMSAVFERFDYLANGQAEIIRTQQQIITLLTEKEINHGTGSNQRGFADANVGLFAGAEFIPPGNGTLAPFDSGGNGPESGERATVSGEPVSG